MRASRLQSVCMPPTRGACTTCTATSPSGPAQSVEPIEWWCGAVLGTTHPSAANLTSGKATGLSKVFTTSVFVWSARQIELRAATTLDLHPCANAAASHSHFGKDLSNQERRHSCPMPLGFGVSECQFFASRRTVADELREVALVIANGSGFGGSGLASFWQSEAGHSTEQVFPGFY